ncbi:MAG: hypothetical protein GY953_38065, partial [bacterium]|nr:hypothetical protein [bacterium]
MSSQASLFDWALILGFFCVYAVIGLRARRRSSSLDDYLVMGRRLGPILGTATLAATETGLVTLIYFAEEAYLSGFVALAVAALAALTMWTVGRTGFVVERLRAMKVRTVPEYLESRFNTRVRSVAGLATFVVGVLNMGIFLQVESAFLAIMLGIPASKTLLVMAVILVVVVAYTMLGGMRSVVFTDVAQFLMISLGAGIATYLMFTHAGGISGMAEAVERHHGPAGFKLWDAPRYGGLFLFWTALYYLSGWSSWQPVVARVLSIQDTGTALRLYRISSVFMFLRAALPMVWGIGALAILGTVDQSSTMLPEALLKVLPSNLIGLVTVGFVS